MYVSTTAGNSNDSSAIATSVRMRPRQIGGRLRNIYYFVLTVKPFCFKYSTTRAT